MVNNSWTVTLGDPPGKHLIEVYIASHHVASFEFEVVKPNRKINTRGRNKVIKHFFTEFRVRILILTASPAP